MEWLSTILLLLLGMLIYFTVQFSVGFLQGYRKSAAERKGIHAIEGDFTKQRFLIAGKRFRVDTIETQHNRTVNGDRTRVHMELSEVHGYDPDA